MSLGTDLCLEEQRQVARIFPCILITSVASLTYLLIYSDSKPVMDKNHLRHKDKETGRLHKNNSITTMLAFIKAIGRWSMKFRVLISE